MTQQCAQLPTPQLGDFPSILISIVHIQTDTEKLKWGMKKREHKKTSLRHLLYQIYKHPGIGTFLQL